MIQVTVDTVLRTKLHNLTQALELCDESGRVLGRFSPTLDLSQYEGLEPQISEEELQRREREGGGRSLADIIADLEKRA